LEFYPILSTYTINKAVNEKRLPAVKLGRARYYKKKDIEKFLESNKKDSYKYGNF